MFETLVVATPVSDTRMSFWLVEIPTGAGEKILHLGTTCLNANPQSRDTCSLFTRRLLMSNFDEKLFEDWAATEAQVYALLGRLGPATSLSRLRELEQLKAQADRQFMALWESPEHPTAGHPTGPPP